MPQTLQAILAMMLMTLFSFHQQRNMQRQRMVMMRTEAATQATGVAVDRLAEIGTKAFDESTKNGNTIDSMDDLTSLYSFRQDNSNDDIDDYDKRTTADYRRMGADTLRFSAYTTVVYADEDNPDQALSNPSERSKYKKVTVKVYNLNIARPDTIYLSQTFSCGSQCDW